MDGSTVSWGSVDPGPYGPTGRSAWLDIDWREHQRWVILDGCPINVIELGEGPPLLFVHGLSGSWQNWLENIPVLAGAHRVIAVDLPGFGHSPMPTEQITIAGYARTLDALLGELSIQSAAVVGNSMGGFISAELAISFPERVQRLVLVSSAGISTASRGAYVPLARRLDRLTRATAAWVASRSDLVAARARLRQATLSVVIAHPARLPGPLAAEQLRGAGKPGFLQALAATATYPLRERLVQIACPTLIVWGSKDRLITVRDAEIFGELIEDSRVVIYPDTGHLAMLERPRAFNALLEDFIAEQPPATTMHGIDWASP